MRREPKPTHLVTALELAVALLITFLTATLLATLATLLSALLTLSAAGPLSIALTARSLLTPALLTATLIFFTIVCHDFFLPCSKC
jgi:predicted membrane protein